MPSPKAIASATSIPAAAGAFTDAFNTPYANGYLMLKLAATSGTISGGGEVGQLPVTQVTLDGNGKPSAGQSMWASDQFSSPINPPYRILLYNSSDLLVGDLGNCVISGAAPVDLTTVTATNTGISFASPILSSPLGAQTITGQQINLVSAPLSLDANSPITAGGKITSYGGVATVGNGVPSLVATADFLAQSANIGVTTLYAVPASKSGFYRINCYTVITQAATTSSTMPAVNVQWTDNDTGSAGSGENSQIGSTSTANTVGETSSHASGANTDVVVNAKASTNITFNTAGYASVGATPMKFNVHIKVEYLG